MSHLRKITTALSVLLFCFLCSVVSGSWQDRTQGLPLVDFFPTKLIGPTAATFSAAQDARGRMFFSGDQLRMYDGATWRSFATHGNGPIFILHLDGDGRIWAGGVDEIGYFTETPDENFSYTSLSDHLPAAERKLDYVWGCGRAGDRIYFVCTNKLLSWDGARFTITSYPTKTRLFPVRLQNELWFTHNETGLYRLTAKGPKLEYPASALPPSGVFHLFRTDSNLQLVTNEGVFTAGRPDRPLSSPAFSRFGLEGRISGIAASPEGTLYVSSVNRGLAVLSQQGELSRVLGPEDGLTSNRIGLAFLDREGSLWCATATGILRLESPGAISIFNELTGLPRGQVKSLMQQGPSLVALADSGVFRLESFPDKRARFTALPQLAAGYAAAVPFADGLLLSKFGAIEYRDEHGLRPVLTHPGKSIQGFTPSRRDPQTAYYFQDKDLHRLQASTTGAWRHELLSSLPDFVSQGTEDSRGNLWLNCFRAGLFCYEPEGGKLTRLDDGHPSDESDHYGYLAAQSDWLFFTRNAACFQVDTRTRQVAPLGSVPLADTLRALAASPGGDRLYVAFERARANAAPAYGLGYFTRPRGQQPAQWHEWKIDKLDTIGAPENLLALTEDGTDVLWIGGSEGAMRLRPDEVPLLRRPAMPYLQLLGRAASAVPETQIFPFDGHRVQFKVSAPEIAARKDLLFQTRLGDDRTPWSEALPRAAFEFTRLSEGIYTFSVRSVNLAGMLSEPASFTFRILPPWYRTGWAYGAYAGVLALTVFGLGRLRERRVRERNRHLEQVVAERTAELVKANAAKDEFLAGISHEIRNPMNGVVGLASTIDTTPLDETSRQRFAYLRHCATHLSSLLDDILDFSKLQAGAVSLDPQPFELPALVQSIAAITATESAQAGIPVDIAVSPAVPRHLVGDAARIRQILLNFVINALKYSGRGTVCLTVWSRQFVPDSCEVTFAVSDDGPGISPEEQKKIFARFERGQVARRNRVPGAGLGLALCATLAEKMGGRLWVESEPGRGASFFFAVQLPVAIDPAITPRPAAPTQPPPVYRALVVDDEEYNRVALSALLAELGFASVTAADSEAALAAACGQRFDAVFLDFDLPGRSGLDIARELRALPGFPASLPVVATTAFGTPEKRAQCLAAGMNAFLSKPVSLEKIRSALASATAFGRSVAPLQAPAADGASDPLATLKLIALRKGAPFSEELTRFLQEFAEENAALESALGQRDPAAAAHAAHQLTGRLGFVHASDAERCAEEIEAAVTNEIWEQADAAWRRYQKILEPLRQRLKAAAD